MKNIRIILNGKKAALEDVRAAIFNARDKSDVEVRVTWEAGDVARFVKEAVTDNCKRIAIAGGDGSVKEVVDALMRVDQENRPELAIIPLGTANDFATACEIPVELADALALAQTNNALPVDCVKANDEYFMNVASGGFGAQVTTNTPVELKNFLGGGAYTLSGLVQSLNFTPYTGELIMPDAQVEGHVIVSAVCNGRQAGGGQQLAPNALISDGLLEVIALLQFPKEELLQVVKELLDPSISGKFVKRFQTPWVEWRSDAQMPINLDGEPIETKKIRFEAVPKAINLVLPQGCLLT